MKPSGLPDVGAPDPERTTSPIVDETYASEDSPMDPGSDVDGVCLYNDKPYKPGDYVWAGDEVLRCDRGGVWVRIDTDLE